QPRRDLLIGLPRRGVQRGRTAESGESDMTSVDTPAVSSRPRTLAEKVWDDHLVVKGEDGTPDLIYIDLHLVHEVTSPQAFDGLRAEGRPLRRVDLTIATEDHNTPTLNIDKPIADLT